MPRGTATSGLSLSQLQALLKSQQSQLARLRKRRAKVARELAGIDQQIERISGNGAGMRLTAAGRARNEKSLAATLEEVLTKAGKPMKVGDIMAAVLKTGYRSNADNFRAIINQTLIKEKQFTAADRGVYTLKK